MKFAKKLKRFTKTKRTNKILAVLIVLAVIAIGIDLIVSHAATPYVKATATSGALSGNAAKSSDGTYVQFNSGTTSSCPSGQDVPVGDLSGWKQVQAFTFCNVPNIPVGSFSGCNGTSCSGLSAYPTVQNAIGDNGDGWIDTEKDCSYYPSETLSVTGGVLNMFIHTDSAGRCVTAVPWPHFNSNPESEQLYGRYSVRMKVDSNSLACYKTAFLLWPHSNSLWPGDGEVDFPEGNMQSGCNGQPWKDTIQVNLHYQGGTSSNSVIGGGINTSYSYGQISGQWHTYTTEWAPDHMYFLIDGVSVFNYDSSYKGFDPGKIPNTPMHWLLQTESEICNQGGSSSPCIPKSTASGNMQFAWIAVWSYDPSCTSTPCH